MSTLQELRDGVRLQTDLDGEDLVDLVLDSFIREGFDRTFATERRWPFFEHTWTLTLDAGETTIAMPTDPAIAFLMRLRADTDFNLIQIAQTLAEDNFTEATTSTDPEFYSIWGSTLTLWPHQSDTTARTYTARGYRKPTWTGVAADELDGDDRLHQAILHYAVALAYAQLEDPELEAQYAQRWASLTDALRRNIMQPQFNEPLILSSGLYLSPSRRPGRVTLSL